MNGRMHHWHRSAALGMAVLVAAAALGTVAASPAPAAPSRGAIVVQWNKVAVATMRKAHLDPVLGLDLAIVHAAIYDAVNSIDRRHTPYAVDVSGAPSNASKEAAAATAAHRVLLNLAPAQQAELDAEYQESLDEVRNGPSEDAGVSVGEQAAAGILALRSNDGRFAHVPYEPGSGPGAWIQTPPFPPDFPAMVPWVTEVTPFTLEGPDQFRSVPPPGLTSAEYTEDFEEVRTMGAFVGSGRSPEQTAIAEFFGEPPIIALNRAVGGIAVAEKRGVADDARLFALVNLAAADATIAQWRDKYEYSFWRPITAIRAADTDGNPDTTANPSWWALLVTPPFPEYTAGHAFTTAAATRVLAEFYGTDLFGFTMSSTYSGATRSYARFSDLTEEVVSGRVWSGSHFRFAGVVGAETGNQVGHWVSTTVAQPLS